MAESTKLMNMPVLPKYQRGTAIRKMKKTCEMPQVECTTNSQRLIHGEVRTEICKVVVGAFVLAIVTYRLYFQVLQKLIEIQLV